MYQYNKINPVAAVQQWSAPINEATGVTDPSKLEWMSKLAAIKMAVDGPINESEKRLIESYGLATPEGTAGMGAVSWPSDPGTGVGAQAGAWGRTDYKRGSGDIPTQIMGLGLNVAAHTVGLDLVATIPVDMPSAVFQFLDSVYGGGDLKTAGKAPQYLSVKAPEINKAFFDAQALVYNQNIFITKAAGADGVAIHGKYMGKSQFTGELIFKYESTGVIATDVYTADNASSVNDVIAAHASLAFVKGASATSANGTPVELTADEVKIDFVSAVREHIAGASNSDGVSKTPMTREVTEKGSDRILNLRLWTTTAEMDGAEILANLTRVQLRDLKSYGIDGLAMLYKAGQNQLIQTINDQIIDAMAELGVANHTQMLTSQNLNLNLFVGPGGTANKALTAFPSSTFVDRQGNDRRAAFGNVLNSETNSSAENLHTRQRKLYSRILAGSTILGNTSRYGLGDVAVVNTQISAALQDCSGFQAAPTTNTIGQTNDLHFIGTAGRVRVYCNPKWVWDDTRIVVGRKGTDEDPGLKFLAYDLASSIEIIDPGTMAPKLSILSRYKLVDAGFFPEANYLTILCANDFGSWI